MSYATLTAFSTALEADYLEPELSPEDAAWVDSPFNWIRDNPSGTKGAIGRELVAALLDEISPPVTRDGTALEVAGYRIRVKFSMAWEASGSFRFQQIRDEDYDYVFCLGLYPSEAFAWFIPKSEFFVDGLAQEREGVTTQHGGATGTDTRWFEVDPSAALPWLGEYGGAMAEAEAIVTTSLLG